MLAAQVKLYACEMVNPHHLGCAADTWRVWLQKDPLERFLRDGRAYAIGAGTSEIQKLIIGSYS